MTKVKVEVKNISKRYGKIIALDKVSLKIREREYACLLGPSGCGKTTLLKIIAGLVKPDEGEVYIDGKSMNGVPPEERNIGFVFQDYALFPHMNIWENVVYGPRVKGESEEKIRKIGEKVLNLVKLFARYNAYPKELSGGMKQRVGLARALSTGSGLLLLDEPLGALDARIRTELRLELRKMVKSLGLTAIHVTHDQEEALSMADKIIVMRSGRVEQIGTPFEVYHKPKNLFVGNFIGEMNFIEGIGEGNKVRVGENIFEIKGKASGRVVLAIRPEDIMIVKEVAKAENTLAGEIRYAWFMGRGRKLEVSTKVGNLLVWSRLNLKAGDKITLALPRESILIYPYPERGLSEELKVE